MTLCHANHAGLSRFMRVTNYPASHVFCCLNDLMLRSADQFTVDIDLSDLGWYFHVHFCRMLPLSLLMQLSVLLPILLLSLSIFVLGLIPFPKLPRTYVRLSWNYVRNIHKYPSTDLMISRLHRPKTLSTLHGCIYAYVLLDVLTVWTLLCNLWAHVLLRSFVKRKHDFMQVR